MNGKLASIGLMWLGVVAVTGCGDKRVAEERKNRIDQQQTDLHQQGNRIEKQQATIADQQKTMDDQQRTITQHETTLKNQQARLAALQETVKSQAADIQRKQEEIGRLNARIREIDRTAPDSGATPSSSGAMTPDKKQAAVLKAWLDLHQTAICGGEALALSAGREQTTVARDALRSALERLGFNILGATSDLAYEANTQEQESFRGDTRCNLVFLLRGSAKKTDKFGDFYVFEAELSGKVVNLTTHQEVASQTLRAKGERLLDEKQAAVSAVTAAANKLTDYLTNEVARKWQATSLVRVALTIANLSRQDKVESLRNELQARSGVYYVSLENWDRQKATARFEVLSRSDAREFLAGYVGGSRGGRITVDCIDREGRVIGAADRPKR